MFDMSPAWTEHWQGMPSYVHKNLQPFQSIILHFKDQQARDAFAKLVGQTLTSETKYAWYPRIEIGRFADKLYETPVQTNPKYPVYVISKGRWESRLTVKALERIKVPYHVVIEPQEYAQYASVIDKRNILTLPFSNLGQGSIPVRNWVWEHSIDIGAERHWILDDNIRGFHRFHNNLKAPIGDGTVFKLAEEFTDRYENVGLSGFQYWMFVPRKQANIPPYYLNTRIYSCILVKNDLPYRWRGRYNEDTDLSLRALTDGWCTILFNAFIADKMTTMTMKGGNTDELYKDDGRLKMAESLRDQHPHLVKITEKWGRYQHHVNYDVFKRNKLKLKVGIVIPEGQNDYGMQLTILGEGGDNVAGNGRATGQSQEVGTDQGADLERSQSLAGRSPQVGVGPVGADDGTGSGTAVDGQQDEESIDAEERRAIQEADAIGGRQELAREDDAGAERSLAGQTAWPTQDSLFDTFTSCPDDDERGDA